MTMTPTTALQPIDVSAQPHLQGAFAPITSEIDVDGCRSW
jgi:hypothetical protein